MTRCFWGTPGGNRRGNFIPALALSARRGYYLLTMKPKTEKLPTPKEIEKEIGDFLSKKYGDQVKMISPIVLPQPERIETDDFSKKATKSINFDLKPEELIAYLDQYVIRQDLEIGRASCRERV